jgi:acyl-CoA reductase-like NAD-dependent aldehyde dehydrogenase
MARPFLSTVYSRCRSGSNITEPSSAEVLGQVADLSRDDFIKAIKIADKGYRKYSTSTTFPQRGAHLRKWFDLIHENSEDCNRASDLVNVKWPKF